ncbi:hypothetical protein GCM10023074_52340 [Microbispora amethystogenes]|uniref:Uncharacterized protein n=1 Tax=Microbispora amethystogenes TaxID=1427754 RepID=A0ABQ4FGQ6_9ACTN|nr:hypothetical protein Mam01_41650 [Microbispora amethystogenes]
MLWPVIESATGPVLGPVILVGGGCHGVVVGPGKRLALSLIRIPSAARPAISSAITCHPPSLPPGVVNGRPAHTQRPGAPPAAGALLRGR